jgi:hypothetical protein
VISCFRDKKIAINPTALKVPIDTTTLAYNSEGKLTVYGINASQVSGLSAMISGKVSSGDALTPSSNLSDLGNPSTARTNLGLGTLATKNTISTADISDGTITDAKLNTITTPGKVAAAAITSGTIGGTTTFSGSGGINTSGSINSSAITLQSASNTTQELRFRDSDNSHYVALKAPDTITADKIWTLPATDGGSGQVLSTNGAGILSWSSPAGAGTVTSVGLTAPAAGMSVSGGPITGSGSLTLALADDLAAVEGLSTTGGVERTGANTWATYTLSAAGKALIDDADATAQRTTLGLGSLSTASAVSGGTGGTITDDTITDADINSAAAIAQSKISGLTTSLSGKEPTITAGTTSQYYRGDKSWQTLDSSIVTENTNLYFTNARARGALSVSAAPLAYNSGTGVFSLGQASGVADGYLASSDFTTFNNKQAAITTSSVINSGTLTTALQNGLEVKPFNTTAGNTGELRFDELAANGTNYIGFKSPDAITTNRIWTLPSADGTSGQALTTNGSGTLSWSSIASTALITGTGGGAAPNPTSGCPTGYLLVPGDSSFNTTDFCVMKYEAKFGGQGAVSQAIGNPAVYHDQGAARSACRNLGPGYALINNNEWMTLATNIANVASNWSSGAVGTTALNRGHSDNSPANAFAAVADDNDPCNGTGQTCSSSTWHDQRRTHNLSNGGVIWDLAGNVWEWVDYYNAYDKPTPATAAWYEFTAITGSAVMPKSMLIPTNAVKAWWNDSWNGATNGIGQMYPGAQGSGGALLRGGDWGSGAVFTVYLIGNPTSATTNIGFRCVFRPSSL